MFCIPSKIPGSPWQSTLELAAQEPRRLARGLRQEIQPGALLISLLIFGLTILLMSCQSQPHVPTAFTQNRMTIDARVLIGDPLDASQKAQVQQLIDRVFDEINHTYNKWNPDSELSQLNRLKAYEKKSLSVELLLFLKRIDDMVKLTEGRFDPTIEPLQTMWKHYFAKGTIPSSEEINALRPTVGWDKIHIDDAGVFFKDHDSVSVDLGGVAKGLCVDKIVESLQQAGYKSLYVEWGGEIRAAGMHPAGRPWNVYISRLGDSDPAHALAYVSMHNDAIATSGDYLQYWLVKDLAGQERAYSHLFDPHTLAPVRIIPSSIASVSVRAADCAFADAIATAIMLCVSSIEGESLGRKLQQQYPELEFWVATRERFCHF